MPDEVGLAFFRESHYLVYSEVDGAVVTLWNKQAVDLSAEEVEHYKSVGLERVTRDELFDRWPHWRAIHDRLQRKLGEEGSA